MLEVDRPRGEARGGDRARGRVSFFDFWRELDRAADAHGPNPARIAPLLAHLGVSLVERAVLDGLCRLAGEPLHRMIAANRLGLRLGEVYPELGTAQPRDLLPPAPLERLLRAPYRRPRRRADAADICARGTRGRRAAAGSRGVHSRVRPSLLQSQVERRRGARLSAPAGARRRCSSARPAASSSSRSTATRTSTTSRRSASSGSSARPSRRCASSGAASSSSSSRCIAIAR